MACPCGLTQEKLDLHPNLVGSNGRCLAEDAGGNRCGRRLVEHPLATPVQQPPPAMPPLPGRVVYAVPAFESGIDWGANFLTFDPPSLLPLGGYYGDFKSEQMDSTTYDDQLTPLISIWMNGHIGSGDNALIARDDALCNIYQSLANLPSFSRNRHDDSTAVKTRCDRADQFDGVTLVRVEEKELYMSEAKDDLLAKSCWLPHYERLPFIFGIAITATNLEILLLRRDSAESIFSAQLSRLTDRWRCVIAMINIARTLKLFIQMRWIFRSLPFNQWHQRTRKKIRLENKFVQVEYPDQQIYERMMEFYKATEHVPRLEHLFPSLNEANHWRISLVPVGVQRFPFNLAELVIALQHITECLFALHELGYVHCDVRWGNIVVSNRQWYLIDCEFACKLDDVTALAQRSTEIAPHYVRQISSPWDPSFDMYQVALLLRESGLIFDDQSPLNTLSELLNSTEYSPPAIRSHLACCAALYR